MIAEKYINPFTDFGFKKIFGEEANKDLLIDFLNELLTDKGKITSLTYLKSEHLGTTDLDRRAIFDLYCENEKGEKFIVEMQRAKQDYFKDRSLYYATFPIQEQAKRGEWNYQLNSVFSIAITDFIFDDSEINKTKLLHDVRLIETETQKIFYDKLRFIYVEIKKFDKKLEEIETHFEKWLYVLKNLAKLDSIPTKLQEKIFKKLFQIAEIAQFDEKQLQLYRDSEKNYLDFTASLETSFKEGKIEGKIERDIEIAKNMIRKGFDNETIAEVTGLSTEQIEALRVYLKSSISE
ncbi:MAG: Rpn family recombination-promoting nuclease/putative transposase [Thermoflexibacter sp.]|nr:Rpn family recombination-promoting nuclease/putative transposase [Thermoflexibacter sp.]